MRHVFKPKARERFLSPQEIRLFLRTVYHSNIRRQFKLSLHLLLITMTRKSELRLARWDHVDFDAGEWAITVENSKTGKPHIVYLSTQAKRLFEELKQLAGRSEYVLPGRGVIDRPFAHNAINKAMFQATQSLDVPHFTIHDLRRTSSTLLHENDWSSDVIEKAMNHNVGGVRGVYNRAQYADQRRKMLQDWANYVDTLISEGKVVQSNFRQLVREV
jgi:integrase